MSALNVVPLSRVGPGVVRWLWEPYLARGKLAVLDGEPGVGKSLLAIDLAARLSRGGPLPDGAPAGRPCVTLLLGAEDGSEDTTRPRAEAAGADLDRVVFAIDCGGRPPRFPEDLPALEESVRAHRVDLVVIDPVMAFLPQEVAANTDQCVRRVLAPLAALAARTDCVVLLIRHLRKAGLLKALYRGLGSVAIIGACRTGLLATHHPTEPGLRVLAATKTNLAGSVPSLGFRVPADRPVVEWAGAVDLTADALCRPAPAPLRARDRASDWLRRELAGGPRKVAELLAAAAAAGIPEVTLRRAKADLLAVARRVHREDGGEWYWYDPCAPWPENAPFRKPFELPPLDPL